ncbi:hypothetical protein E2C01_028192 [Portunus trituberculatus]|uniref:Uncharacterized protein n=1 Tax=Portunus trituberculatus TaxID=210409 RepID=A0A5B7EK07_PORTR|nr:hypothetical protein [Portunus trituberculatus]
MDYIKDHPSVVWAERNLRRGSKDPRKQVIAMWEGEVPAYLDLPGIRSCKIEKYPPRRPSATTLPYPRDPPPTSSIAIPQVTPSRLRHTCPRGHADPSIDERGASSLQPRDASPTIPGDEHRPPSPSPDSQHQGDERASTMPITTLHSPTTNTAATITQSSLQDEVETLRQEVKTLKLSQDIMQKANQDLQTMVAALHVTLKAEMSSMKALLMKLASQTKITSQATAAPRPSTHMDVDDTPQQMKIPAQHTSNPLPRGEASNAIGQATLRKDNTNDDLTNHAHLPPALPSSPPLHSTNPPQQLPQQPPHLSANTKQALPPQHSATSKGLANNKHLPPAFLLCLSPLPGVCRQCWCPPPLPGELPFDSARLALIAGATRQQDDTDQAITREELLAARKSSADTAPEPILVTTIVITPIKFCYATTRGGDPPTTPTTTPRQQAERRRLQRESEAQHGDSTSARWMGVVDTDDPRLPRPAHTTRRLELVRSRIRLGYPVLRLGVGDRHARGEKTVPPV